MAFVFNYALLRIVRRWFLSVRGSKNLVPEVLEHVAAQENTRNSLPYLRTPAAGSRNVRHFILEEKVFKPNLLSP